MLESAAAGCRALAGSSLLDWCVHGMSSSRACKSGIPHVSGGVATCTRWRSSRVQGDWGRQSWRSWSDGTRAGVDRARTRTGAARTGRLPERTDLAPIGAFGRFPIVADPAALPPLPQARLGVSGYEAAVSDRRQPSIGGGFKHPETTFHPTRAICHERRGHGGGDTSPQGAQDRHRRHFAQAAPGTGHRRHFAPGGPRGTGRRRHFAPGGPGGTGRSSCNSAAPKAGRAGSVVARRRLAI